MSQNNELDINQNVVDMPTPGGDPLAGVSALLGALEERDQDGGEAGDGGGDDEQAIQGQAGGGDDNLDDTDDLDGGDDDAGDGEALEWLTGLAESASIEVDEIYNVKVPMDGREPMTIGELKDAVSKAGDFEQQAQDLADDKSDFENEMIRARQELNTIVSLLPELPPELVARAKQEHTETLDRERKALIAIKPEWADAETWRLAQDEMVEITSQYGFSRNDVEMGSVDHRLIKMVWDYSQLLKRVSKANERLKEVKTTQKRAAKKKGSDNAKQREQQRRERAKQGNTAAKVGAVQSILDQAT